MPAVAPITPLDAALAHPVDQALRAAPPAPGRLRETLENRLGAALGGLRIGVLPIPSLLGAQAFACRGTIIVEPAAFTPDTAGGIALLVHEAAHILQ